MVQHYLGKCNGASIIVANQRASGKFDDYTGGAEEAGAPLGNTGGEKRPQTFPIAFKDLKVNEMNHIYYAMIID